VIEGERVGSAVGSGVSVDVGESEGDIVGSVFTLYVERKRGGAVREERHILEK
jgi:hypothetical protein